MQIRGECISFASYNKKTKDNREKNLIDEINDLEKSGTSDNHVLTLKKTELQNLRAEKMEGAFIRSKSLWIDSAEKPSAFFSI